MLPRSGRSEAPDGAPAIAHFSVDGLREDERQRRFAKAAKATKIPFFDGHVEHAFDIACTAGAAKCPRCGSATEQQYASFIYATQIGPRVMFVPAGEFCTQCPSVIIDQELIEAGISSARFTYAGVLGSDYGESREPDLFRSWNGENAVYIFDEDQTPLGMSTRSSEVPSRPAPVSPAQSRRQKSKKRKQASRGARRIHRRK